MLTAEEKRRMEMDSLYGPSSNPTHYDVESMSAPMWRLWVAIVRNEAEKNSGWENLSLAYRLVLPVARELRKTGSTMTAHTLCLLLNEVDSFRTFDVSRIVDGEDFLEEFLEEGWGYDPEQGDPCAFVREAYDGCVSRGEEADAELIAESFTTLNGEKACN